MGAGRATLFCPMVRCMGICPVREAPRALLAVLSPYPGLKKKKQNVQLLRLLQGVNAHRLDQHTQKVSRSGADTRKYLSWNCARRNANAVSCGQVVCRVDAGARDVLVIRAQGLL